MRDIYDIGSYTTAFANPSHYFTADLIVTDEMENVTLRVDMSYIMSFESSFALYADTYDIGNTVMNQITFTIDLAGLVGATPQSINVDTYIAKGSMLGYYQHIYLPNDVYSKADFPTRPFYCSKPDYDSESGFLTATAYDSMFRLNVIPFAEGSQVAVWDNPTLRQVAHHLITGEDIAGVIESNFGGVNPNSVSAYRQVYLEDETQVPNNIFMPSIPYGYTVREIFGEIATATCGNWTITYNKKDTIYGVPLLRLVSKLSADDINLVNLVDENDDILEFADGVTLLV